MNSVILGPCDFIFDVDNFQGHRAANGNLPNGIEECIKQLFRAIRATGHNVLLEYMSDGVAIFEECGVFIHIKREPDLIAILRIEELQ